MFIIFILVLLGILMGVLSSIYSVFSPFIESIGNVVNFNSAYYGALAGVERAQLVLKYKQPGFEGSGGFLQGNAFGPESDNLSGGFGFLTQENNGFSRDISSRTKNIPNPGEGNVDYLLTSGTDSNNYNKLPYFSSEKIGLSIDTTNNSDLYYTGAGNVSYFSGGNFTGILRLSPKAKEMFNNEDLCDTCDTDQDGISNDIVVNRILNGFNNGISFAIVPNISIFYYSGGFVDTSKDIAIRESFINETGNLYFGDTLKEYSPLGNYTNTLTNHNVLSLDSSGIINKSFQDILSSDTITGLVLGMGIINHLTTISDNIYPFLEYRFSFPQFVADNFFTIQSVGLVGDYNVKIYIKKSTNEESSIGDFTIIF